MKSKTRLLVVGLIELAFGVWCVLNDSASWFSSIVGFVVMVGGWRHVLASVKSREQALMDSMRFRTYLHFFQSRTSQAKQYRRVRDGLSKKETPDESLTRIHNHSAEHILSRDKKTAIVSLLVDVFMASDAIGMNHSELIERANDVITARIKELSQDDPIEQ